MKIAGNFSDTFRESKGEEKRERERDRKVDIEIQIEKRVSPLCTMLYPLVIAESRCIKIQRVVTQAKFIDLSNPIHESPNAGRGCRKGAALFVSPLVSPIKVN